MLSNDGAFTKLDPATVRSHKGKSFVGVSTAVTMFNGKGELFMAKRSINARDEHGRWDVCGGGLKWGIEAEDNVRREMLEEFGVSSKQPLHFLGFREAFRTDHHGHKTHWVCLDYMIILTDEEALRAHINEKEIFDDFGWYGLDSLPEPLHSLITPQVIKKLKKEVAALLSN